MMFLSSCSSHYHYVAEPLRVEVQRMNAQRQELESARAAAVATVNQQTAQINGMKQQIDAMRNDMQRWGAEAALAGKMRPDVEVLKQELTTAR